MPCLVQRVSLILLVSAAEKGEYERLWDAVWVHLQQVMFDVSCTFIQDCVIRNPVQPTGGVRAAVGRSVGAPAGGH